MASIGTHQISSSRIQPTKDRILCKRYTRPERTPAGIWLPPSAQEDQTWSYWEVIACGPDVKRTLGILPNKGAIIRTPFRPAIDLALDDEDGSRLFIVPCLVEMAGPGGKMEKVSNVTGVIQNTWSKEEEDGNSGKVH